MKRPGALLLAMTFALVPAAAPIGAQGQARTDPPRPIEAGTSLWAEELTWMEIRDLVKAGTTTINKTPGQPADARTDTRNGMHDDIYYESQIAVLDPKLIRAEERRKAGLLHLHGVDESSIARVVEIGKKLADYRAGITAKAFKASHERVRPPQAAARALDIYWIDVEGGASTLIVTPQGQAVLMDAGWGGFDDRDALRIERVVKQEAGLSRIDHVLVSHFHQDHAGGLAALARRIPIGTFVDHGETVDKAGPGRQLWQEYLAFAGSRRRTVRPGERLALDGVELTIVASDGQALKAPLAAADPNALCASFKPQAEDLGENGRSLGYLLRAGKFEFVNLGDLSWNFQRHLACPANLLGTIDVYQAPHHAVRDDVLPQLMWAMSPAVAVMSNGPAKGAGPAAVETILRSPGLEDMWSLHRAVGNDAAHNAPERLTANLGETDGCKGDWIRARVSPDGSYTVTNSRNGFSKTYRVK